MPLYNKQEMSNLERNDFMKKALSLVLGGLFLLFQAAPVWASTAFTVSATVPLATGISLVVDSVNSTGTPVFTQVTGANLSFDPMTFNTANNIYIPGVYYAINVASSSGSGLPDTTLTYTEGSNPNSGSASQGGLGTKSTATFAQELGNVETITSLGKKRLIDLTGTVGHQPYTSLATGSYLRVYVGVWTGSTTAPADPSNGQPFSNADAAGTYTGTLTVTAVVN
jgi:hypothetical protein